MTQTQSIGPHPGVRYVVMDENVLGYIYPEQPQILGILHASVLRGSTLNDLDGLTAIGPLSKVRDATAQDFRDFRVIPPKGLFKKYGIEVKGSSGWNRLRPTRGEPYEYDTQAEAERMARICYPDEMCWGGKNGEEVVRVVEV